MRLATSRCLSALEPEMHRASSFPLNTAMWNVCLAHRYSTPRSGCPLLDAQCRSPLAQRLRVSLSGPHPGINEAPFSCAALPTSSIGQGGCPRCGCEGQTQSPESPYRANLGASKYGGPCVSLPPPVAQGPVVRRQWDLAVSDWHYMNSLAWVVEPRPEIGPTESINAFFSPVAAVVLSGPGHQD